MKKSYLFGIIQYSISTNSWSDYLKIICHLFCTLITCNTGFSVLLPYFNKLEMFLIEGVTAMLPRVYSKRSFLKTRSDVRRKKKMVDVQNLSEKGQEMYDISVLQYSSRMSKAWKLEDASLKSDEDILKTTTPCPLQEDIYKNFTKYGVIKEGFRWFHMRIKTDKSEQTLKSLDLKHEDPTSVLLWH